MKDTKLKAAKAIKLKELKADRDRDIFAPFNGFQVDTARSRDDLTGMVNVWESIGNPASVTWTLADNTEQAVTKADLEAVILGFAARKLTLFAAYQALKEQVNNALTVDEVNGINWS